MNLERFLSPRWECVHFLQFGERRNLENLLGTQGICVKRIDGNVIRTEQDLISQLAAALRFPEYFGRNWDAVEECLRDLDWLPASGFVLVVSESENSWKSDPKLMAKLLSVWLSVAEEWSRSEVPFHLVIEW